MRAKFDGTCPACGGAVVANRTEIARVNGRWQHASCEAADTVQAARTTKGTEDLTDIREGDLVQLWLLDTYGRHGKPGHTYRVGQDAPIYRVPNLEAGETWDTPEAERTGAQRIRLKVNLSDSYTYPVEDIYRIMRAGRIACEQCGAFDHDFSIHDGGRGAGRPQ